MSNIENMDQLVFKLNNMIDEYNSLDYNIFYQEKIDCFYKVFEYIKLLADEKIIEIEPKDKSLSYLLDVWSECAEDHAYCAILKFNFINDKNTIYKIGTCCRGNPLIKKVND